MSDVHITLVDRLAKMPAKGSAGAAGYDLYLHEEEVHIPPKERRLVGTGVRMRIPRGIYGRIAPRSGLAVRDSIDIGAGVIDQDYRGELKVLLINNGTDTAIFHYGMRVAQIVFERIETPAFTQMSTREFDEYDTTNRGVGGFGSTGSGILKSL